MKTVSATVYGVYETDANRSGEDKTEFVVRPITIHLSSIIDGTRYLRAYFVLFKCVIINSLHRFCGYLTSYTIVIYHVVSRKTLIFLV